MTKTKRNIFLKGLLAGLMLFGSSLSYAQKKNEPKLEIDKKSPDEINTPRLHTARGAAMRALVLPSWGQFYNKKYWKMPIVLAGYGVIGYFAKMNNDNYKLYKQAYVDINDDDPNTNSFEEVASDLGWQLEPEDYDWFSSQLQNAYEGSRNNRDLSYILIGAWHLLQMIDANVDASLMDYDVSDDLTLSVTPSYQQFASQQNQMGVTLTLKF